MRLLSHVWSIARGSVAGITYTANQWHQIIARARTAPTQPQSEYQQHIRGAFHAAQANWEQMTPAQRADWDAYAATCTYIGPLGSYQVPGRNMWIAVETFRDFMNVAYGTALAMDLDAPTKAGWASIGPVSVIAPAAGNTGYSLNIPNPDDVDITVINTRSIGFHISRNSYKGPWLPGAGNALEITSLTSGRADFYNLDVETAYFGTVRGITTDGPYRLTQKQYYRAEGVTTPP